MLSYQTVDIITLIISGWFVAHSFKNITASNRYTYHLLFCVFYVFPILIDTLYKIPDYENIGFSLSAEDTSTRYIYDVVLLLGQYIILYFKNNHKEQSNDDIDENVSNYNRYLIIGMLLPSLVAIFLVKNPMLLIVFQWRELHIFDQGVAFYYVAERFSYIGITCVLLLLFSNQSQGLEGILKRILYILFLYFNICIQGKRAAFFFSIIVMLLILFFKYKKYLKSNGRSFFSYKNISIGLLFAVVMSISINLLYTTSIDVQLKRTADGDNETAMTNTRIDFFRDDRIRMAIYSENNPEKIRILDNYGQTMISDIKNEFFYFWTTVFFKIKREPLTYQHYFSNGVVGNSTVSEDVGFMTVTFFAELISNFGIILGVLLFPLLCVWFSKVTDKFPYPLNIIIASVFVLLNMFDTSYIFWYLEASVLLCYSYYRKSLKR